MRGHVTYRTLSPVENDMDTDWGCEEVSKDHRDVSSSTDMNSL